MEQKKLYLNGFLAKNDQLQIGLSRKLAETDYTAPIGQNFLEWKDFLTELDLFRACIRLRL
jgi:hypothetical protein